MWCGTGTRLIYNRRKRNFSALPTCFVRKIRQDGPKSIGFFGFWTNCGKVVIFKNIGINSKRSVLFSQISIPAKKRAPFYFLNFDSRVSISFFFHSLFWPRNDFFICIWALFFSDLCTCEANHERGKSSFEGDLNATNAGWGLKRPKQAKSSGRNGDEWSRSASLKKTLFLTHRLLRMTDLRLKCMIFAGFQKDVLLNYKNISFLRPNLKHVA